VVKTEKLESRRKGNHGIHGKRGTEGRGTGLSKPKIRNFLSPFSNLI